MGITFLRQIHTDHGKDGEENGDCHRTAVACLLGLQSPEELPHWWRKENGEDISVGREELRTTLAKIGYTLLNVHYGDYVQNLGYHILSGPSPRLEGVLHSIVGYAGVPFHDPHPNDTMLGGDQKDWIVEVLVPLLDSSDRPKLLPTDSLLAQLLEHRKQVMLDMKSIVNNHVELTVHEVATIVEEAYVGGHSEEWCNREFKRLVCGDSTVLGFHVKIKGDTV